MTDNILSMLGLAHKAGKVEIGEEPVGSAARAKKARVIFVADDAAPSTKRRAKSFAETGSCILLPMAAEKDDMGRVLGRTSCAMCAVTEIGFACAIVKKLAAIEPEKYRAAADALEIKAKRAAQRRQEQEQHEKNLKQGKKRETPASAVQETEKKNVPKKAAAERPAKTAAKRPARPAVKKKKPDPGARFAGSLPVKKGKGSKGTNSRTKVRDHH